MTQPPLTVGLDSAPTTLYAKKDLSSRQSEAVLIDSNNRLMFSKLIAEEHDYISFSPAALPTTIVFKSGGSGGTTVATLTIAYTNGSVSSITKS